ncbi:MAG: patatin-like phospholipase family protein [Actinomycetota bacterium]
MPEESKADVVLEGGGVKGIALVGALSVLMDAGYAFPRVAGTSAGAIVGALVAAGMPAERMKSIMAQTDYRRFQDESWLDALPGGKIISILKDAGIYEGEYLRTWLAETLGDVQTFGDLALPEDATSSLPPDQRYRLVVNVSDVSLGQLVRFPWDYQRFYGLAPSEQRIADAVRASMSIPFFFEPATLEYERTESGAPKKVRSTLVDGGMLSNFPVDIFDRTDGQAPRWPTFGIKLSSKPDAIAARFPDDVGGPIDLTKAMITTMTSFRDAMHINRAEVIARTIFVDTLGVGATDFDIDQATQDALFQSGVSAAQKFLGEWSFDAYVREFRTP